MVKLGKGRPLKLDPLARRIEQVIETTQMAALMVAAAILMSYRSNGARYRGVISLVSGLLTGGAAAWLMALYTQLVRPDPVGMAVALVFLCWVLYCRGNVAKMLDLLKEARHWRR